MTFDKLEKNLMDVIQEEQAVSVLYPQWVNSACAEYYGKESVTIHFFG